MNWKYAIYPISGERKAKNPKCKFEILQKNVGFIALTKTREEAERLVRLNRMIEGLD